MSSIVRVTETDANVTINQAGNVLVKVSAPVSRVSVSNPPGPQGPSGQLPFNVTVSPTPPLNPVVDDVWIDTTP